MVDDGDLHAGMMAADGPRPRSPRMIDHTLLAPEATADDVVALCEEATDLGVAAVCVSPSQLPITEGLGVGIGIATVIGFPSGAHQPAVKAARGGGGGRRRRHRARHGGEPRAGEGGEWLAVGDDIARGARGGARSVLLKVIVESACLTDAELVEACRVAEAAGADYVKTSTGFHPAGGASRRGRAHACAATVGGRLGVKASGGHPRRRHRARHARRRRDPARLLRHARHPRRPLASSVTTPRPARSWA